ncbi:hypothetical protein VNO80_07492 [Phaseolus coccineus]|uniref:Uncharacterized protein n=1 Tax=Phaseolus coccineus TaxID=3886 RepID=A0AAN9NJS8_PHACN
MGNDLTIRDHVGSHSFHFVASFNQVNSSVVIRMRPRYVYLSSSDSSDSGNTSQSSPVSWGLDSGNATIIRCSSTLGFHGKGGREVRENDVPPGSDYE